ncbi:hypothetical protein NliqN6_1608 [Naganishia liquefaciens]|uniref:DUF726 domain-containing protein n=1 Tax=Naganishia liquefaciens TaxID=104408 RepID=A0A8H3TQP9_9TREE|nr:hypothetical protein NliqN6_1608 [Naganishia liquefaciens]
MASLISSIKAHAHPASSQSHADPLASLPTPPTLPPQLRLLVALATIAATTDNPLYAALPQHETEAWRSAGSEWAVAVRRMLQIDEAALPSFVSRTQVSAAAEGHWADMEASEREAEKEKIVRLLVIASIFQPPIKGEDVATVDIPESASTNQEKIQVPKAETVPTLSYTPPARQFIYTTLTSLHIPSTPFLPTIEKSLAASLYTTLQQVRAADVDAAREKQAEGWGGSTGRWIATGVGAVVGGVAIGLTGGLAAPAIAALVPSFMTFGLLTSATAPVVIGSVFGLAGGGLTSKRVRERWRGVAEFEFVDVKIGSVARRASIEKVEGEKGDESAAPSLIATIVVPGLLTKSRTEAVETWRDRIVPSSPLQDGRDVFVLNYETEHMLQTGKAIDNWVTSKLKGYVKKEVIKRTVLSAYFMAVSLPMSVYNMASLGLDNTWVQSQDKAIKAGRLLGEVLEKRVQGQRPVILIGSSLGALTILHALLYLASRTDKKAPLPQIVDSAFLISLPSAPSTEEWASCRQVVARRLVNGWCEKDLVLAGIVRLHEVLSRAVTLQNGVHVAGLRAVNQPGVEDVDLSEVIEGHLDIQRQMNEVLKVIKIDE